MKRALGIMEILVAIGVLAALFAASSVVFSVSVRSQRTAAAASEITARLRAVTDSLDADFTGLRKDAPMFIWFEFDPVTGRRFDQIMFFADGDFQSVRQYPDSDGNIITVHGNIARLYYGHANKAVLQKDVSGVITGRTVTNPPDYRTAGIFARRSHLLTAENMAVSFPAFDQTKLETFPDSFVALGNDCLEYDTISLSLWKDIVYFDTVNSSHLVKTCFDNASGRPCVDMKSIETLPNILEQGIGSFSVQWSYRSNGRLLWFPSEDPDGNGNISDSDFDFNYSALTYPVILDPDGHDAFGFYFNMPSNVNADTDSDPADNRNDWFTTEEVRNRYLFDSKTPPSWAVVSPEALKFTFTIYDSRGIFKNGKKFTYIVYLNP